MDYESEHNEDSELQRARRKRWNGSNNFRGNAKARSEGEMRLESLRVESDATAIVRIMEHEAFKESLPSPQNEAARAIVEDMRFVLSGRAIDEGEGDPEKLRLHAQLMDLVFRRLLADADVIDGKTGVCVYQPAMYLAAFRAQEQFRKTVRTIRELEEFDARLLRKKMFKKYNENKKMKKKIRKKPTPRIGKRAIEPAATVCERYGHED